MRQLISNLLVITAASAGLLLNATGTTVAQNGDMSAGMSSSRQQPGDSMELENSRQPLECNIFGNMRRNFNVELELSKLALTHSSNDDVRKFSEKVIQDDLTLNRDLSNLELKNGSTFLADEPGQTAEAEQEMEKVSGPRFDQMYLVEMDAYVKNDQQLAHNAAATVSVPELSETGMRARILAEQRAKRIEKLAAEESFKME